MTEILLIGAGCALVLFLVSGLYDHGLDDAKTRQAAALIGAFDRAVRAYHDVCQAYPPGDADGRLRRVLPQLLSVPESKEVLRIVSPSLLYVVDGRPRCRDPWGSPLRCLTSRVSRPELTRRVERNGGVPIFECAGPDGRFGDRNDLRDGTRPGREPFEPDALREVDNIRSDEPLHLP